MNILLSMPELAQSFSAFFLNCTYVAGRQRPDPVMGAFHKVLFWRAGPAGPPWYPSVGSHRGLLGSVRGRPKAPGMQGSFGSSEVQLPGPGAGPCVAR